MAFSPPSLVGVRRAQLVVPTFSDFNQATLDDCIGTEVLPLSLQACGLVGGFGPLPLVRCLLLRCACAASRRADARASHREQEGAAGFNDSDTGFWTSAQNRADDVWSGLTFPLALNASLDVRNAASSCRTAAPTVTAAAAAPAAAVAPLVAPCARCAGCSSRIDRTRPPPACCDGELAGRRARLLARAAWHDAARLARARDAVAGGPVPRAHRGGDVPLYDRRGRLRRGRGAGGVRLHEGRRRAWHTPPRAGPSKRLHAPPKAPRLGSEGARSRTRPSTELLRPPPSVPLMCGSIGGKAEAPLPLPLLLLLLLLASSLAVPVGFAGRWTRTIGRMTLPWTRATSPRTAPT
eukprot:scaffold697_cov320-Prasinococcus_capsulatus_cf.AAC.4